MLEIIENFARVVHIGFGFLGLAAFWVPIFAKKGARIHRTAGQLFVYSAYVVLGAAALALMVHLAGLVLEGQTPSDQPMFYGFIVFLAYLTIVTFVTVRHGTALLRHKRDPEALGTPLNVSLAVMAIASSAAIIFYAMVYDPPIRVLLFALSPIGLLTGTGILRYIRAGAVSPRVWWYEHMGAMLGAGIAFHTAFAVFGATRLFDVGLTGALSVVPWVAPAAIGIPATAIWTRYYRRKFGEPA
jgi:hypothetical protein